ncbi:MAG: NAD-dependent epimerase/dehydratase family protein, partial [Bacteroidales bacterium]|nr:NAD-dependent epimerase/dehydratase family protein [Bacteroidales bacterium]
MILVTGGTGLLGAHLLFDLLRTEDKVRAIKREQSNLKIISQIFSYYTQNSQAYLDRIEWLDAEITDYVSVEEAMIGIDKVYHCAAVVSFQKNDEALMMDTNIDGTKNIVNACLYHKVDKLIHVSSIAALGRAEVNETTT